MFPASLLSRPLLQGMYRLDVDFSDNPSTCTEQSIEFLAMKFVCVSVSSRLTVPFHDNLTCTFVSFPDSSGYKAEHNR